MIKFHLKVGIPVLFPPVLVTDSASNCYYRSGYIRSANEGGGWFLEYRLSSRGRPRQIPSSFFRGRRFQTNLDDSRQTKRAFFLCFNAITADSAGRSRQMFQLRTARKFQLDFLSDARLEACEEGERGLSARGTEAGTSTKRPECNKRIFTTFSQNRTRSRLFRTRRMTELAGIIVEMGTNLEARLKWELLHSGIPRSPICLHCHFLNRDRGARSLGEKWRLSVGEGPGGLGW